MTDYSEYLRDESRLSGVATQVLFATSEQQVADVLRVGDPVTLQGARTGIVGAAVPTAGKVLNLSKLSGITALGRDDKGFWVDVLPGTLLCDLRDALKKKSLTPQDGMLHR